MTDSQLNRLTIEEVDLFIKRNANRFGAEAAVQIAKQLASAMRALEVALEALEDVNDQPISYDEDLVVDALKAIDEALSNKDAL